MISSRLREVEERHNNEMAKLTKSHLFEVSVLNKKLETARAKVPKAVPRSSRGKRKSNSSLQDLESELADNHDVKYLSAGGRNYSTYNNSS